MATELAYPRADRTFTVGDITDLAVGRVFFDDVQADPTSFTITTSMQRVDEDGAVTGDPVDAVTASVITDTEDGDAKAIAYRIDTTTEGIEAGRWRWESTVSGTDPNSNAFDIANSGGYLTLIDRLQLPPEA